MPVSLNSLVQPTKARGLQWNWTAANLFEQREQLGAEPGWSFLSFAKPAGRLFRVGQGWREVNRTARN
jgi:hypothetical protein